MDPILTSIIGWPCDWAPQGWLFCDGQTLSIQQNTAIFALLGTNFGGDGVTNFQLPNLQHHHHPKVKYIICVQGIFPSRP